MKALLRRKRIMGILIAIIILVGTLLGVNNIFDEHSTMPHSEQVVGIGPNRP